MSGRQFVHPDHYNNLLEAKQISSHDVKVIPDNEGLSPAEIAIGVKVAQISFPHGNKSFYIKMLLSNGICIPFKGDDIIRDPFFKYAVIYTAFSEVHIRELDSDQLLMQYFVEYFRRLYMHKNIPELNGSWEDLSLSEMIKFALWISHEYARGLRPDVAVLKYIIDKNGSVYGYPTQDS